MGVPRIAIISFPGTNGDTENLRAFKRNGFDPFVFRWNDSKERLDDVDGYFIGAGFSYEDRGRAGMVAARDPLLQFLYEEAERGKVIVGHCNGCQVLVESGLIPLSDGLRMCLGRNAISSQHSAFRATGFLNEWIWITRTCSKERCATSDWDGPMHIPIAHGEGRWVTSDPELIAELEENDQVAFRYCNAEGKVSSDPSVTLNGSTDAIVGICNPAGNVVAMMPHPERTENGDPYFQSMKRWIDKRLAMSDQRREQKRLAAYRLPLATTSEVHKRQPHSLEIFIDTIIVNNEERTVEQAGRRAAPRLSLKQFRYLAPQSKQAEELLKTISLFNPNKELAYVREGNQWSQWNPDTKKFEQSTSPLRSQTVLRRDEPDTGSQAIGGGETGVCYSYDGVSELGQELQEIFANPHASTLELMTQ